MLEREDGAGQTSADDQSAVDFTAFNPDALITWVQSHEQWAKQIARDDRRYGEASLMLTYAKELLALLECSKPASSVRSEDPPMVGHEASAGIAALVQRITELRSGAQSLRREDSVRCMKRIR
jgi:hypothetical protein